MLLLPSRHFDVERVGRLCFSRGRQGGRPSHLLSTALTLLFLSYLPYTMREMAANGFPLSIGSAGVMLYIKPVGGKLTVQFVTCPALQQSYCM